jgi:hypothetical protein
VENTSLVSGPILPDRLTEHYQKKPDHPTFFAKGTDVDDDTVGGSCVTKSQNISTSADENAEFYSPPVGWVCEKLVSESSHEASERTKLSTTENSAEITQKKRVFTDDSELDYIPREEFGGRREGYVFRLGSKGIGYYQDRILV